MEQTPLQQLREYGQSPWLHGLTPELLRDGTLERAIRAHGIRGAIADSALSAAEIQQACDILRPMWEESGGEDGYVSHAADPELVARPNFMVAISATEAGLSAIEEAIAAGLPVNATRIYRLSRHDEVIDAYVCGIERLIGGGADPGRVASIASFEVSAVDAELDPRLAAMDGAARKLCGRLGIANARLAYQGYKRAFDERRWHVLAARGARPQRCCWASTSMSNPGYCDVAYVEELIGPETVTALSRPTIEAFEGHGVAADKLERGVHDARALFEQLRELGIDLPDVWRAVETGR